ncbi:uncharacterized protein LOC116164463 [Photinus pyralis]|uniref:uncharacterized protein LOC116164463 n=1 Tax=Photinus pyralis TaxID=7054 RepID=UPI001266FF16|nr:uncharacterized protein LOC116164463 [Photinus pyralis]
MSTECFFGCLKRFIGRRGIPTHIYSDNASTFRGANNELNELGQFVTNNQNSILTYATNFNISWHYIPPYSPNFGGLWEAAVKSMKFHLKRVMNTSVLTFEEFSTLLTQIESILNSRPLSSMSNDPNDLEPITPAHFLIGRPITAVPTPGIESIPQNRLSRWQYVQQLRQHFWTRFSKEYIHQLHQTYKWKTGSGQQLHIDSLVLIQDKHQPPNKWALGRISKLIRGPDDVPRVAEITTSHGLIKRSTRHLCPLPVVAD